MAIYPCLPPLPESVEFDTLWHFSEVVLADLRYMFLFLLSFLPLLSVLSATIKENLMHCDADKCDDFSGLGFSSETLENAKV